MRTYTVIEHKVPFLRARQVPEWEVMSVFGKGMTALKRGETNTYTLEQPRDMPERRYIVKAHDGLVVTGSWPEGLVLDEMYNEPVKADTDKQFCFTYTRI